MQLPCTAVRGIGRRLSANFAPRVNASCWWGILYLTFEPFVTPNLQVGNEETSGAKRPKTKALLDRYPTALFTSAINYTG